MPKVEYLHMMTLYVQNSFAHWLEILRWCTDIQDYKSFKELAIPLHLASSDGSVSKIQTGLRGHVPGGHPGQAGQSDAHDDWAVDHIILIGNFAMLLIPRHQDKCESDQGQRFVLTLQIGNSDPPFLGMAMAVCGRHWRIRKRARITGGDVDLISIFDTTC